VKIGDLVKLSAEPFNGAIGIIVRMVSFAPGRTPLPHVLVGGKVLLFGREVCEVINESR
jgi:hypothetical protein